MIYFTGKHSSGIIICVCVAVEVVVPLMGGGSGTTELWLTVTLHFIHYSVGWSANM